MGRLARRENLTALRERTQPRRDVDRVRPPTIRNDYRLTNIDPHTGRHREARLLPCRVQKRQLKRDRRPDRLPRRFKRKQHLVAAVADALAPQPAEYTLSDRDKPPGQPRSGLITPRGSKLL